MTEETKRIWDVVIAISTVFVAFGAFLLSLRQWGKGQEWQRAAKGRELIDDLLKSNDSDEETYAWDAMRMLDYQDEKRPFRTKKISGQQYDIFRKEIRDALGNNHSNSDELIYVRECFDEFFFRLGQLQDAMDNDLVTLEHVSCPLDYYIGVMANDVDMKLYQNYMRNFDYERALEFLDNFPVWRDKGNAALQGAKEMKRKNTEEKMMRWTALSALATSVSALSILFAVMSFHHETLTLQNSVQQSMTGITLELDHELVEHPELRPYLESTNMPDRTDTTNYNRACEAAIMTLDVFDVALAQTTTFKDNWSNPEGWTNWIAQDFARSPFLQQQYLLYTNWYGTNMFDLEQHAVCSHPNSLAQR